MSTFIRNTSNGHFVTYFGNKINDEGVQEASYRITEPYTYGAGRDRDVDILWSRSSFPGNVTASQNGFGGIDAMHQYWEWCWPVTGTRVRKQVTGTVKDSSGSPVSGATVMLFNTASGTLVDTQTSDSSGVYKCEDPNNVASFAVGYEAGSPDTAGTTVNTITGS